MSEFKGTKGWHLIEGYIKDENNDIIADVFGINEKDRANALLISKAPQMLEMLEEVLNYVDWSSETWENATGRSIENKIEQLIKEATQL